VLLLLLPSAEVSLPASKFAFLLQFDECTSASVHCGDADLFVRQNCRTVKQVVMGATRNVAALRKVRKLPLTFAAVISGFCYHCDIVE
jgi:hypothetical protein